MRARAVPAVLAAALVAASCAADDGPEEGVTVVATTSVLGDVTTELVGDAGTVEALIPRGADPHEYQASAAQAAQVREADLVVANGLGLEEGLDNVLAAAADAGVPVLELGPRLDPIPNDPHVWLDPLRMADGVRLVAEQLADMGAGNGWADRADGYVNELETTHEEVEQVLGAVPDERRQLVTDHDSFGYFAERYDFAIAGTIVPGTSPLAAPTAQHLAELAELIRTEDIPAVFLDVATSDTVAETLRREAGVDVAIVRLNVGSLGAEGTEAGTYTGMLLDNAQRVAESLGG